MVERAEKVKKYETIAMMIKSFVPSMKMSIEEIAATFYQGAMERQDRQAREMGQNIRMSRMPKGVGDVQRILDIGK